MKNLTQVEVDALVNGYENSYELGEKLKSGGEKRQLLVDAAKTELGFRIFLMKCGFIAFINTF
nr:hypothetical protein [Maribacter sp. ACAM166]